MNSKTKLANAALLLAAFLWGTTFIAQSVGMDYIGPFTFLGTRSFIGAAALVVVALVMDNTKKRNGSYAKSTSAEKKILLIGGLCCGIILCIASGLQQVGLLYTSVGNAGFITSMYMLLVPVFSLFLGQRVGKKLWFCIVLAAAGLYFISITEHFTISKGDFLMILCAVAYAVQIMVIDYFAPKADAVKLSCLQFVVTGIISMVLAFVFEEPDLGRITDAIGPLLYAGIFSSGVAFTLQIVAQKIAQPTIATLFMSMESVFSLLGGIVVLHEIPNAREALGCILVLCAVVMSQVSVEALKGIRKKDS